MTTAQIGLRRYNFDPACGEGSRFVELTNPCQSSAGFFVMGDSDTPLRNPIDLTKRLGIYVARGKYRFGGVFIGPERRFVFGLDHQLIPYVF